MIRDKDWRQLVKLPEIGEKISVESVIVQQATLTEGLCREFNKLEKRIETLEEHYLLDKAIYDKMVKRLAPCKP